MLFYFSQLMNKIIVKLSWYLLISIAILGLLGCENDLDIIDDYKDIPVIYGLLNSADTTQYIRIQKAYLGEGNSLLMAQYADSIYYDTSIIELKVQKIINGLVTDEVSFMPTLSFPKEEGLFSNYPSLIYKSDDGMIDAGAEYKLQLTNKATGEVTTSLTSIVKMASSDLTNTVLFGQFVNMSDPDDPLPIKFTMPIRAKICGLQLKVNYVEYVINTNVIENKSIMINAGELVVSNIDGTDKMVFEISRDFFYGGIALKIPYDPTVNRPANQVKVDFIFTVGADDFYTFYKVSHPSGSLTGILPEFTNLSNGRGIFSSRSTFKVLNKELNSESKNELRNGPFTGSLFD